MLDNDIYHLSRFHKQSTGAALKAFNNLGGLKVVGVMVVLILLVVSYLFVPKMHKGEAKLHFASSAHLLGQVDLLSSDMMMDRLAEILLQTPHQGKALIDAHYGDIDKILADFGLIDDWRLLNDIHQLAGVLADNFNISANARGEIVSLSYVSQSKLLAKKMPNLLAREYLTLIEKTPISNVRMIKSASLGNLDNAYGSIFDIGLALLVAFCAGVYSNLREYVKQKIQSHKSQRDQIIEVPTAIVAQPVPQIA